MKPWIALLPLALCACATTNGGGESLEDMMSPWQQVPPQDEVSGALGGPANPVRVFEPEGEREYLYRLRCPGGAQPTFERRGSSGFGPYKRIVDIYSVKCEAEKTDTAVYMDMYHCVEETLPVPGFTIVPEIGHRDKPRCR